MEEAADAEQVEVVEEEEERVVRGDTPLAFSLSSFRVYPVRSVSSVCICAAPVQSRNTVTHQPAHPPLTI